MKMNRIKLHKQVGTMNKEQLIVLCKSLIDISCELEDRKDKAIKYIKQLDYTIDGIIYNKKTQQCISIDDLLNILRGENNE